jgi:hypothetical protein
MYRPEPLRELAMHRREAALDLYNAVLGAFLAVSPWLFDYAYGPARDGAFASGVLLTLVSLLAIAAFREWEEWVNLLIGCWIVASPWVLDFTHRSATHIAVLIGTAVTMLAVLELWLIHNPDWLDKPYVPPPESGEHRG